MKRVEDVYESHRCDSSFVDLCKARILSNETEATIRVRVPSMNKWFMAYVLAITPPDENGIVVIRFRPIGAPII